MKTPVTRCALALMAAVFSAGTAAPCSAADTVPVYDATQLALDRYAVVKRLGVQDWRSAFGIKSYGDLAAAQQSLSNEAKLAGADGIINLTCFDQTDALFNPVGYYCYGNAIKLRK